MEVIRNVLFALLGVGVSFLFVNQIFLSLNCGFRTVKELAAEGVIDAVKVKSRLILIIIISIIMVLLITAMVYGFSGAFPSYMIAFVLFSFLVIRKSGQSKHNLTAFVNSYGKFIEPNYLSKFKKDHNIQ